MRLRIWSLLVLLVLCFSAVPTYAEIQEVDDEEPARLLDEAALEKLATLQDTPIPFLGSDVSPDDTTVLIDNYRYSPTGSAFLNVNDGSIVPIQGLELPEDFDFFPIAGTEIVWLDDNTLGQVILDLFAGGYLLTVDRWSGQISLTPVNLPFFPISLAPNASKMFVAVMPDFELSLKEQTLKSPFGTPLPSLLSESSANGIAPRRSAFQPQSDQRRKLNDDQLELGIFDLNTGEYTMLMNLPEDSVMFDYGWSPDGSKFGLIRDTLEYSNGQEGKRLTDAVMLDVLGEYSPKDNPFFIHNVVDLFDLGNGDLRPEAWRAVDGDGSVARNLTWSTDGSRVMVEMNRPAQIKGRRYPSYFGADKAYFHFLDPQGNYLSSLDAPETNAPYIAQTTFVSPDEVLIDTITGTSYQLYYYNQGSGEFRKVSSWDGMYYNYVSTRHSRQIIYSFSSFQNAPDIYRMQWDGKAIARMTWTNAENEKANNIRVDNVAFTLRNGAVRKGYLLQPAGAAFPPKNSPIVVWQEGGPTAPMMNRWATNVENPYNLLPNFGVPVLFVPLPGRLGFGPEFLNALADGRNFGQIDIDEGAEIVEQMVQKGWTAPGKIGVTGCSYGGYFTSQSITRHPLRYGAANTQCTLLDTASEWHFGLVLIAYLEGRTPMDDPAEYAADSPIARASAARTPTLLFHGSFDFLPIKFAYDFHDQMEVQKIPTKLIEFHGEGHGLTDGAHQFRAAQEQLLWFRKYLAASRDVASTGTVSEIQAAPSPASVQQAAAPPASGSPKARPAPQPARRLTVRSAQIRRLKQAINAE